MIFHAVNCPARKSGECLGCDEHPFFHVRYEKHGTEVHEIFVGVPDEQGNYQFPGLPTPCLLLSITMHGFAFCEVCDVGPNRELLPRQPLFEVESTPGTPTDTSRLFKSTEEYDAELIRAEVEAMEWPEVIGE